VTLSLVLTWDSVEDELCGLISLQNKLNRPQLPILFRKINIKNLIGTAAILNHLAAIMHSSWVMYVLILDVHMVLN